MVGCKSLLSFFVFLCLPNKLPEDTDLFILMLVEVEAVPSALLDLRKVVVEGLLGDVDHACPLLQRHLLPHSYPRIQLPPSQYLLDHVLYLPLLQPPAFQICVPLLLRVGLRVRIGVTLLHDGLDVLASDEDRESEGGEGEVVVFGNCHFKLGTEEPDGALLEEELDLLVCVGGLVLRKQML